MYRPLSDIQSLVELELARGTPIVIWKNVKVVPKGNSMEGVDWDEWVKLLWNRFDLAFPLFIRD